MQDRWHEWDRPYLLSGILLEIQLKSAEARQTLETAIALGANTPEAYYYQALAITHASPDDLDGAQSAITHALALTSKDPYVFLLAGKIALAMKRPQSRNLHRGYHRRIDALHPVVPFRARSVDVIPHAYVHRKFLVDFPVVLDEFTDLVALGADQVRDLVLAPGPRTAIANQKTRHGVAAPGV